MEQYADTENALCIRFLATRTQIIMCLNLTSASFNHVITSKAEATKKVFMFVAEADLNVQPRSPF